MRTTTTHPGLIQAVCSHCATLISLASTHGPLATAIWGVAPGDVAGLSTSEDYTADHRLQCVTCGDDEPGARTHVRLSGPVPLIPGYVEVPVVNVFTTPVDDVDLDADHLHVVEVEDVGDGHEEPDPMADLRGCHGTLGGPGSSRGPRARQSVDPDVLPLDVALKAGLLW
jgi:hypothetical protein